MLGQNKPGGRSEWHGVNLKNYLAAFVVEQYQICFPAHLVNNYDTVKQVKFASNLIFLIFLRPPNHFIKLPPIKIILV